MISLSVFAERLNELMLESDLNATAVAKKLCVDKSTISRYLSEEIAPTMQNAISIADLFNCSLDFLLGLSDDNLIKDFKECPPFGERLEQILKRKGKTKYALKKQTEISQSLLYYWTTGRFAPSIDNIVKIAEFLDCSVDYLIGRADYE